MVKPKKKRRKARKKRNLKINVSQSASLVQKSDNTRVVGVDTLRKAPTKVPTNGIVFKVKVKKKT